MMSYTKWPSKLMQASLFGALTTWTLATLLANHPDRRFTRVRDWDRTGTIIPDWRFFAPQPGTSDYHLVHRYLYKGESEVSPWMMTYQPPPWKPLNVVWYPEQRGVKGVADACMQLPILAIYNESEVLSSVPYQLLERYVASAVSSADDYQRCAGFQFAVIMDPGLEIEDDIETVFTSGLIPVNE